MVNTSKARVWARHNQASKVQWLKKEDRSVHFVPKGSISELTDDRSLLLSYFFFSLVGVPACLLAFLSFFLLSSFRPSGLPSFLSFFLSSILFFCDFFFLPFPFLFDFI